MFNTCSSSDGAQSTSKAPISKNTADSDVKLSINMERDEPVAMDIECDVLDKTLNQMLTTTTMLADEKFVSDVVCAVLI